LRKKRILMVANTAWYLVNFRQDLISSLLEEYEVVAVTPKDGWETKIPCEWREWSLERRSLNPFLELRSFFSLFSLIREIDPDLIHSYTVKPVIYGTVISSILRGPLTINSVTGLGHLFLSNRLVIRLLRRMVGGVYHLFAYCSEKVFFLFQNRADRDLYLEKGFCKPSQALLVPGSGVDTKKFSFDQERSRMVKNRILFVGRMIREKGIEEIFAAANLLSNKGKKFEFQLVGDIDQGNPSGYTKEDLSSRCVGSLHWLGRREDIKELLEESEILILPSYREGIPRSILEAFSKGVPVIATDVPGCSHLVTEGTGVLIPPRDAKALADAIEALSSMPDLQEKMRRKARRSVEADFDTQKILQDTKMIYRKYLA